eukprot:Nk52_evm117s151 gene=Nk52_evmTU117s151
MEKGMRILHRNHSVAGSYFVSSLSSVCARRGGDRAGRHFMVPWKGLWGGGEINVRRGLCHRGGQGGDQGAKHYPLVGIKQSVRVQRGRQTGRSKRDYSLATRLSKAVSKFKAEMEKIRGVNVESVSEKTGKVIPKEAKSGVQEKEPVVKSMDKKSEALKESPVENVNKAKPMELEAAKSSKKSENKGARSDGVANVEKAKDVSATKTKNEIVEKERVKKGNGGKEKKEDVKAKLDAVSKPETKKLKKVKKEENTTKKEEKKGVKVDDVKKTKVLKPVVVKPKAPELKADKAKAKELDVQTNGASEAGKVKSKNGSSAQKKVPQEEKAKPKKETAVQRTAAPKVAKVGKTETVKSESAEAEAEGVQKGAAPSVVKFPVNSTAGELFKGISGEYETVKFPVNSTAGELFNGISGEYEADDSKKEETTGKATVMPKPKVNLSKGELINLLRRHIQSIPFENRKYLADSLVVVDCEMYQSAKSKNALGQCTIIDGLGNTLLDDVVRPEKDDHVVDARTRFSGLTKADIIKGKDPEEVLESARKLLRNKHVIGHDIRNDLSVLKIHATHSGNVRVTRKDLKQLPMLHVEDTLKIPSMPMKLRYLNYVFSGTHIQGKTHNPVEDCLATLLVYLSFRRFHHLSADLRRECEERWNEICKKSAQKNNFRAMLKDSEKQPLSLLGQHSHAHNPFLSSNGHGIKAEPTDSLIESSLYSQFRKVLQVLNLQDANVLGIQRKENEKDVYRAVGMNVYEFKSKKSKFQGIVKTMEVKEGGRKTKTTFVLSDKKPFTAHKELLNLIEVSGLSEKITVVNLNSLGPLAQNFGDDMEISQVMQTCPEEKLKAFSDKEFCNGLSSAYSGVQSSMKTNDDFRTLLMTPRAVGGGVDSRKGARLSGMGTGGRVTLDTTGDENGQTPSKKKNKKRKEYNYRNKDGETGEGTKGKYRDRASERRRGVANEYTETEEIAASLASVAETSGGQENFMFGNVETEGELNEKKSEEERKREWLIEKSKYLGGDMAHTHLVKGLDYTLLNRSRAELEEEKGEKTNKNTSVGVKSGVKGSKGIGGEGEREKIDPNKIGEGALAKSICHVLFDDAKNKESVPSVNKTFSSGTMSYDFSFDSSKHWETPAVISRRKVTGSNLKGGDGKGGRSSTSDIVINKLISIWEEVLSGKREKRKEQKKAKNKEVEKEREITKASLGVNSTENGVKSAEPERISMFDDDPGDYLCDQKTEVKGKKNEGNGIVGPYPLGVGEEGDEHSPVTGPYPQMEDEVTGPYPQMEDEVTGPYPQMEDEVTGPYPQMEDEVTGPYPQMEDEVTGPYPQMEDEVAGPYPQMEDEVTGPYPQMEDEVTGPYPQMEDEVTGPYPQMEDEVTGPYPQMEDEVTGPYPQMEDEVTGPYPQSVDGTLKPTVQTSTRPRKILSGYELAMQDTLIDAESGDEMIGNAYGNYDGLDYDSDDDDEAERGSKSKSSAGKEASSKGKRSLNTEEGGGGKRFKGTSGSGGKGKGGVAPEKKNKLNSDLNKINAILEKKKKEKKERTS